MYSLASASVGALQKVSELSTRFQIVVTCIFTNAKVDTENLIRRETYFKTLIHGNLEH